MKVAIDGPAGAGKSTISKQAAKELGYIYVDTGAMYRAVALFVINQNGNTENSTEVLNLLNKIDIDIRFVNGEQRVFLCGEDVSEKIRLPEVSVGASQVAVIPEVRIKLVELQRELASKNNVIMDGRDIGTYVLPDADIKIFLTADVNERAKRRYDELCVKGTPCSYEEVLKDMKFRDKNDSEREFAPLRQAEDATLIDTTFCSLEESIKLVTDRIMNK